MIYVVIVGVALRRPPAVHEYRKTVVSASSLVEAELIACQMAACASVMPVMSICKEAEVDKDVKRCIWLFRRHPWGKWSEPERKQLTEVKDGKAVPYASYEERQHRR